MVCKNCKRQIDKVQNYYEITTALLRLEHVQKAVDVGGLFYHFFVLGSNV